jgi:protein SFI1
MRVYETHKNAQSFAVQYHTAQVRYKITLYWRVLLRKKLKTAKTARLAARYFAVRQAWKVWRDRLEELRRQQQLKRILITKKKAIFDGASRIFLLKSLLI